MSYSITRCYSSMPNQAEGKLNGDYFYFRARHGYWTLSVGDTFEDSIDGKTLAEGEENRAGWWSEATCLAFVTTLLERFSDGQA